MSESVAEAYLSLLADRGVDCLFGNAGTDFAPLIEAYASATQRGAKVPRPILAAHENLAVSMAHGYGVVSRKIPAVMVHVSVGTANMVCAAMNASRENVPILLTAGRSPITETGLLGSRDGYIHWAQEMYDQAGLVREFVKWDYELRVPEQVGTVIDRALSIAASEPQGPIYLSLPREVLAMPMPDQGWKTPNRLQPASPAAPDAAAIEAAAEMLAKAKSPLIVAANAARNPGAFEALSDFAQRFALPVLQHRPRYLCLPSSHPMNLGYNPGVGVPEADVILVLESDVPWLPHQVKVAKDCKIIQCGFDPHFSHIPIRSFSCDLGVTGGSTAVLKALSAALDARMGQGDIAARRSKVEEKRAGLAKGWTAAREAAARRSPISPVWVSHCLDQAKDSETIVINEYTLVMEQCGFEKPGLYFGSSSVSGLGWGAGAALGAKLAAPGQPVVAVLGDGAYMFSNPVVVHHAAAMHKLPVLFVIMNNNMWNAVRRATVGMYPGGEATQSNNAPPFIHLDELPAFEDICTAAGGYGERVENPDDLPAAFGRAMAAIREGRQALLNVICSAAD